MLEKRLKEEKTLVEKLEKQLKPADLEAAAKKTGAEQMTAATDELTKELTTLQGDDPLVQPVVDGQAVADVVSGWTGIPVGKMDLDGDQDRAQAGRQAE